MKATYRNEISRNGFRMDVLKSGLQKYIRRGNVDMAMYCCAELDSFSLLGESRDTKRIRTNMVHRLLIVFAEDVGLGGMGLVPMIVRDWQEWSKDRSSPACLKRMVYAMCLAKKTRACSFTKAYYLSQKTDRVGTGEDLKTNLDTRSWDAIFNVLDAVLVEPKVSKRVYTNMFGVFKQCGLKYARELEVLCKEINTKEKFIYPLLCVLFHLFGGVEEPLEIPEMTDNWDEYDEKRELDEFVYDKHTRGGKGGRDYFLQVSSKVENEVNIVPDLFKKTYYE